MSLELRRALQAIAALVRDPGNTMQVFALIEALSGTRTPELIARRLEGTHLLRERPEIMPHLDDRAALGRLREDCLGRAYLRFVESAGITAEGLREASRRGETVAAMAVDVGFVRDRMRDTHDLWHVVLGYGTDVLGEAAVLAFTFAQTGNAALGVLVLVGLAKIRTREAHATIARAFVRGLRAAWFPAQAWEALLDQPLDELRERLRVGATPTYAPVFFRA